jgi:hypothetical protein
MSAMKTRGPLLALCLAALGAPSPAGAVPRAGAAARGARFLVRVGDFVAHAATPARDLAATAREALLRNLAREGRVVLAEATPAGAAGGQTLARRALEGYSIGGRVRVVEGGGATRVEVSLLVQTHPGGEYRFESAVTLTLSGAGGEGHGQALEDATRRAVGSAALRCVGEMARR